jgi:hypothetical protein
MLKNQKNTMEIMYIKINIDKSNKDIDNIREEGLFFSNIAEAISLDRASIEEIDESNYLSEINNIKDKYLK